MRHDSPDAPMRRNAISELRGLVVRARPPRIRPLGQFAVEEIVVPEGKHVGERLRFEVQPYVGLLYQELDSGHWWRVAIVGCVQAGKSLCGFVTPILWHLFERSENVIVGVGTADQSWKKWTAEIRPVIQRTRYRHLIPRIGRGSRGGNFTQIVFRNGARMEIMTGGGDDVQISSSTSRVVVATEVDKWEEPGESSREADRISRLEARTYSYDEPERRLVMECTPSIEEGRIWREYQANPSQIVVQCPACREWSTPEREHLKGWQPAKDVEEARDAGYFACPRCEARWSEEDRVAMNRSARLLLPGQTIDAEGRIEGERPRSHTFGFRWNAFNNLFWSVGTIAAHEWRVAHAVNDQENAERECLQFWWARPYTPPALDEVKVTLEGLATRIAAPPRGIVPGWADYVAVGVDLGKWLSHWLAIALRKDGRGHVIDYGRIEVPSDSMAVEWAVYNALLRLRERMQMGWAQEGRDGVRLPDQVWIDARYTAVAVYAFCRNDNKIYKATAGYSATQDRFRRYQAPKTLGKTVRAIGEQYHVIWNQPARALTIELDADHWKSKLHESLRAPLEDPGAMTVFEAMPNEHLSLFKHLMAEEQRQEFVPERGIVVARWIRRSTANHWLDAGQLAMAAGHFVGVRGVSAPAAPSVAPGRWFAQQEQAARRTSRTEDRAL